MIATIEVWMTWLIGGLLAVSALLTLIRLTIGPSVLDRVVATDVLVSIAVCVLGAHIALNPGVTSLPLLISLSLIGFIGAVAVARFVARDRDYPVEFEDEVPIAESAVEESAEEASQRAAERLVAQQGDEVLTQEDDRGRPAPGVGDASGAAGVDVDAASSGDVGGFAENGASTGVAGGDVEPGTSTGDAAEGGTSTGDAAEGGTSTGDADREGER